MLAWWPKFSLQTIEKYFLLFPFNFWSSNISLNQVWLNTKLKVKSEFISFTSCMLSDPSSVSLPLSCIHKAFLNTLAALCVSAGWRLTQALLDGEREGVGGGVQRGKWGPGSTSFLSGGSGWEHSGGCLLLSCRWGSGGVCCHGSRAGPLDSLVWCGWPLSAAGSLRWCDSHCRVSDCQCLGRQKRRRQAFMGPDNGQARTRLPFSYTLIMWILLHTFVGAPYLFNRWREGCFWNCFTWPGKLDGDTYLWDACVGKCLWHAFVCASESLVCVCTSYMELVTCPMWKKLLLK